MREKYMLSALFAQAADLPYSQYETYNGADAGAAAGAAMLFLLPALIIGIISIIGLWKVFKKAGKPGWAAIIPVYNLYILLQIAEKPSWWLVFLLLSFIPVIGLVVSLVFSVILGIEVAKRFGKSEVFGAIVCGLLSIGYVIIGFDSSTYKGSTPAATSTPAPTATPPANPAA